MEGLSSSSDRARKLFERGVDIVANDIMQGHPNSLLHTPHRDTSANSYSSRMSLSGDRWTMSASQTGVYCGSGGSGSSSTAPENSRLFGSSARINSATPEYVHSSYIALVWKSRIWRSCIRLHKFFFLMISYVV